MKTTLRKFIVGLAIVFSLAAIVVLVMRDRLVSVLDFVGVVALPIAAVGFLFMLVGWANNPIKSTLFFIAPLIIGLFTSLVSTSIAEFKTREFLDAASNDSRVTVDGRVVQNGQQVLDTFRALSDMPAHHSHPTRILNVDISDPPRHLLLWVARDSSNPQEYWVFAPSPSALAFRANLKKEIGRIKTSVFDGY